MPIYNTAHLLKHFDIHIFLSENSDAGNLIFATYAKKQFARHNLGRLHDIKFPPYFHIRWRIYKKLPVRIKGRNIFAKTTKRPLFISNCDRHTPNLIKDLNEPQFFLT